MVKASSAQTIVLLAYKYLKASDSKSSEEQRKK